MTELVGSFTNGGFHSHGGTPKWMVYKGKSYLEMDDIGAPPFMDTPTWMFMGFFEPILALKQVSECFGRCCSSSGNDFLVGQTILGWRDDVCHWEMIARI